MWQLTKIDNYTIKVNLPVTKSELKKEKKELIAILSKSMSKKQIENYLKTR